LENWDHFFLSGGEKENPDSLKLDGSLLVSDMGRVFIFWRDRRQLTAYERGLD
jgi:hypothetical protein